MSEEMKQADELGFSHIALRDLIDLAALQNILDSFSRLTGISTAVLDLKGEILIASGWMDICTQFYRLNPLTAARCFESDTVMASQLKKGESFKVYECKNGLVDAAVPIIIGDLHVGNLFAGQFLFEPPDMDFFAHQAAEFGFVQEPFLEALQRVPIFSQERIRQIITLLADLTVIIGNAGLDKLKLFGTNKDLEQRIRTRTIDLKRRIEFEGLIAKISSELAGIGGSGIDAAINRILGHVGSFTGSDRAYVFQFTGEGSTMSNTHEWCAPGINPQMKNLQNRTMDKELPWFFEHMLQGKVFHVPDVNALPPEAKQERAEFESEEIQSLLVVPMETADGLRGFLGFDAVRFRRAWSEDDQSLLQFLGETLCHVIDRRRAEKALSESEMRWQFALESAGDGLWDWDAVSNRVYFSPQWKAMLGYSGDEIRDALDEWESRVHPDDLEEVRNDVSRHLKGETPVYQNEHRLRCRDGSYKWILDRGKVIEWTEDRKPKRVIGTHTDVSHRKRAEAERERLISELKTALADVKTLRGLLPICSNCKKIRNDTGYWEQIETYISNHSEAKFSHGICRDCAKKLYPEYYS